MASIKKAGRPFTLAEIDQIEAECRMIFGEAGASQGPQAPAAPAFPTTNRGGKSISDECQASKVVLDRVLSVDGHPVVVPGRRGHGGEAAFVDWINFTVKEESFFNENPEACGPFDQRVILEASFVLERILGFGITAEKERGANFYARSYELGEGWGLVCHGGQRETVLVSLYGSGCAAAREGWEERLHEWLTTKAIQPRITRADLAHDDEQGEVSVDDYLFLYQLRKFNTGGRNPNVEQAGNWIEPTGKGRTLYVGSRENGKFFRAYEKGRQLGDVTSEWVRTEVEFKSVSLVIPLDVLLRAGEYLAAAYPACGWISGKQCRIKTTTNAALIVYDNAIAWLKKQVGAYLWSCAVIEGEGDEWVGLAKLAAKVFRAGVIPARLKVPDFRFAPRAVHADIGMCAA